MSGFSEAVRVLIYARDRMRCIICGERTQQIHHRRPRGMGGTKQATTNAPANGVLLCGSGTTGCHHRVESNRAEAVMNGWLVPQGQEPSTVPILIQREWFMLDDMGARHYMP